MSKNTPSQKTPTPSIGQANASSPISGLAWALLQAHRLTPEQVHPILSDAKKQKIPFIEALLKTDLMKAKELADFCSETFGCAQIDIAACNPEYFPKSIIDEKVMQTQHVIALAKRSNKLFIAISDPTNLQTLDQIKFQTELIVEPIIVRHDDLAALLEKLTSRSDQNLQDFIDTTTEIDFGEIDTHPSVSETTTTEVDDAPVVRFLNKLLIDAINMRASDLHFEPFEKFYRVRFRIDGMLREVTQPPLAIKEKLVSRIKVLSRLDISEKRVPQDGRMKLVLSQSRAIDFRVNTLPTLFGEKVVMRILDGSQAQVGIDALGYESHQKEILQQAIERPYGMVLVTGPTGSGKTVSLYTFLNIINKPGVNISTAEDPAEINLPGINQVNINERAGLTFPVALKAFLRQDPDVVMIGEIRDLETADIAVKAAQTGHMVFSTLHTNDAPSTLTRLMNMGVAPFNIASSVILITAQRLVRRLCSCKKVAHPPKELLLEAGFQEEELNGSWKLYQASGCEICNGSGYKGRVGIYQLMPISEAIERLILTQASTLDIETQARKEGMQTLREAGLIKVKAGVTSLEEVLGSTNV